MMEYSVLWETKGSFLLQTSTNQKCKYRPQGPEIEPNQLNQGRPETKEKKKKKERHSGSFNIQTAENVPSAKLYKE